MTKKSITFKENPFDIETVFESIDIASEADKELLYMDQLIQALRANADADLTKTSIDILEKMGLMAHEETEI